MLCCDFCDLHVPAHDSVAYRDWEVERLSDGHYCYICGDCLKSFVAYTMNPFYRQEKSLG